jgi:hypothetical protein
MFHFLEEKGKKEFPSKAEEDKLQNLKSGKFFFFLFRKKVNCVQIPSPPQHTHTHSHTHTHTHFPSPYHFSPHRSRRLLKDGLGCYTDQ